MNLTQAIAVLDFARDVIAGKITDKAEIARRLVGLALDAAPIEDLKAYLSEEARKRDDAIADVAEAIKVEP